MLCLGNKQDKENERQIPFGQARDFADREGMLDAVEASAKENVNIDQAFLRLAKVSPVNLVFFLILVKFIKKKNVLPSRQRKRLICSLSACPHTLQISTLFLNFTSIF